MKWSVVFLIGASVAAISQAVAVTPVSHAILNRRQLADCMTKQMAASRTISYNEASKVCKDRIKAQADSLEARNEARPANAR